MNAFRKFLDAFKGRKNRKGFTLVEVLLVLTVATAIISIGFRVYASVNQNVKLTNVMTQVLQVRSVLESLYGTQGFSELSSDGSTAVFVLKSSLPRSMFNADQSEIVNAYNGMVKIGRDQLDNVGDSYYISMQNIDDVSCAKLIMSDLGHSLIAIHIDNSNIISSGGLGGASDVTIPVTPSAAFAVCNGGVQYHPIPNAVTFQFR